MTLDESVENTLDQSVENLKIVVEAFERLRVGLSPFVEATVTERFNYLATELLVDQLRRICPHEGAAPLPEMPDTFTGMDILDILKLLHNEESLDTAKVFKREFRVKFIGPSWDLGDLRNKAAHHNGLASKQFTLKEVNTVIDTAIEWLKAIPKRHAEAKEQLAKLKALQSQVGSTQPDSLADYVFSNPAILTAMADHPKFPDLVLETIQREAERAASPLPLDLEAEISRILNPPQAVGESLSLSQPEVASSATPEIEALDQAIRLNPQDDVAYFNRGLCYLMLQRYQDALDDFSKSIELDQDAAAYGNRGLCYHALQQYPEALADYAKAIDLNPQDDAAYYNRGLCYGELGRQEEALADFSKAIELNPQDAISYLSRGVCYIRLQQYPEALADYAKAIALDPQFAPAYLNRGVHYNVLGQQEEALADFAKAIALDPQFAPAYDNRGICYGALQRYQEALDDFYKAIDLNPQFTSAYLNRGNIYVALQQYHEALDDYAKAIALDPQFAPAYGNRGLCYRDLQRFEEAVRDFTAAIAINPESARLYQLRGDAYELWGDQSEGDEQDELFELAIADFEEADRLRAANRNDRPA